MSLVGVISRTPRIEMAEWLRVIRSSPDAAAPPARVVKNPFTGQMTTAQADPGTIQIQADGRLLGAIEPSDEFEDDGELRVYSATGVNNLLNAAVHRFASALGADVEWVP